MLIEEGWCGASLSKLAELQLQPFVDFFERQVSIEGPAVLLKPEAAQALGLALHELANNAKKFGALSVPEGQVSVRWSRLPQPDGDSVDLKWVETGGPSVAAPAAPGFGSIVIERNLKQAVAAMSNWRFSPTACNAISCFPRINSLALSIAGPRKRWNGVSEGLFRQVAFAIASDAARGF